MTPPIQSRKERSPDQPAIKVLHVLNDLQRSGAEMNLLRSASVWRRYGFNLDVLATATEVGPLADDFRNAGYGVHHLPLRSKRRYLPSRGFCSDFVALCRNNEYDIVHIHTEKAYYLMATLCKIGRTRTIVRSVHSVFAFDGWMRKRKQIERAYARLLRVRFGFVSQSVSLAESQRFKNRGVLIQNWFDADHFRPPAPEERLAARQDLGIAEDALVVVSVGNCCHAKNHSAIIRAISLLRPSLNVVYLHVGREDSQQTEKHLIDSLGLAEHAVLAGQVGDPRPYLWAADIFAMPSLWEGLGVSALEAAGTGLPLILANVDGLRDVAEAATGSYLVTPTPEALSSAILAICNSDRQQTKLHALEDSQRVRSSFHPSAGVRSLINNLYQIAM